MLITMASPSWVWAVDEGTQASQHEVGSRNVHGTAKRTHIYLGFCLGIFFLRKARKEHGSSGRARTADQVINSHLLYQLSY